MAAHHEVNFEAHIVEQLAERGWLVGDAAHYDRERALYPEDVIGWIRETQPEKWERLERTHGADAGRAVLDRLAKALAARSGGALEVLRRGFGMAGGGTIRMSQAKPEDARNPEVMRAYEANRLRIVRQVRYSLDNENAIDLVAFINGIPVATFELKTDFTQSVQAAIAQYRNDRNPKSRQSGRGEPLLSFRRGALVHFAMSDSEVWMTTKLAGANTRFLPFNRGNDGRAGNPPNPGGYPVAYMWERVMQPEHWLRIFHRFMFLRREEKETATGRVHVTETMIFPRFHQWEAVTDTLADVRAHGVGRNYLYQHSAGSGKTNTISWTAHELIRMRHENGEPFFHSVIVVTDRTVLDAQLQEAVARIDHQLGVVAAIDRQAAQGSKSQQLTRALLEGTPIIVVTLQTFPHAMQAILTETSLRDRRFAVIIDEAHNSQTGATANKLRQLLALESNEEMAAMTPEEILARLQEMRRLPGNVSHFAFTATPKHSTLTLFGRLRHPDLPPSKENPPVPFHLYTMQQAIEEGFILDVLQNYTSYKTAFRLGQRIVRDRRVDEKTAGRALARWVSLHPTNVAQKVELVVEHFLQNVAHRLNGQAKAMVVASSRAAAVKYKLAFDEYVKKKGYRRLQALVAFSGKILGKEIKDAWHDWPDDLAFSEESMNPDARGRDLRQVFDTPEYQVMIVANKFQTGFDQPKLMAMYLDKKVSGVEAVQTLSRLNRVYPGKDTTFIVDFVNDPEEIVGAFRTFYRDARIADVQDPDIVFAMKDELDAMHLYEDDEVRRFGEEIAKPEPSHERLYALTQPAMDRFNARMQQLNEAIEACEREYLRACQRGDEVAMEKAEARRSEHARERDRLLVFKEGLGKYVRTYEYIAQLADLNEPRLEALAAFARLLAKRLQGVAPEDVDLQGLQMTHYRLIRRGEQVYPGLGPERELEPMKGEIGREPRDRERTFLHELIERINKLHGEDISDQDAIAFTVHVSEKLRADDTLMAQVRNNPKEQALKGDLPAAANRAIVEAMDSHRKIAARLLGDEEGRQAFLGVLYEMLSRDMTCLVEEAREGW